MTDFRQPHRQQATFQEPSIRGSVRSQNQSYRSRTQASPPTHQVPNIPGEGVLPGPPGALHRIDGDAFNVDPNVPYLDSGALEAARAQEQDIPPASRSNRKFVGGFVSGLRRAMWGKQRPQEQVNMPVPDTAYTSPEYRYASPTPPQQNMTPAPVAPAPMTPAHRSRAYTTPTPMTPAPMNTAPMSPTRTIPAHQFNDSSHLDPQPQSPLNSSETAHETPETVDTHGGTTVVEHETLPAPMVMGSPIYVEPQPGSDYAKMDSPRRSAASFGSYMSRVQKFFHDINELPWVADRVTVDYFPGQNRRRERPVQTLRPVTSWYNAHPEHPPPSDLFSASPPMVTFQFQRANEPPSNAPFAGVIYPSGSAAPATPAAYGPARGLDHNTYPMAMVSSYPASAHQRHPSAPVYPHGYVPYQQQGAATAHYPELSVHVPQPRA